MVTETEENGDERRRTWYRAETKEGCWGNNVRRYVIWSKIYGCSDTCIDTGEQIQARSNCKGKGNGDDGINGNSSSTNSIGASHGCRREQKRDSIALQKKRLICGGGTKEQEADRGRDRARWRSWWLRSQDTGRLEIPTSFELTGSSTSGNAGIWEHRNYHGTIRPIGLAPDPA